MGAYEYQFPPVNITTQPSNQSVCELAANTSFEVVASGTGLTYLWQISKDGGINFNDSTGATNNTLLIATAVIGMNGYQYRCIVNGDMVEPDTTDVAMLTVHSLPTANAGTDVTVCTGQSVTLAASGGTSYAWSGGVTNGTPFTPASTNSYTVTATDVNGCTGADAVTVTVNSLPTANAGSDVAVCSGQGVTLTADRKSVV